MEEGKEGGKIMKTIKTNNYSTLIIKNTMSVGDILLDTETIENIQYNIYVSFCGYCIYYAVKV